MFASILLLVAAQDPSVLGFDQITAPEAAERFALCGLGPATLRLNDPEMGGEDILVATNVKSATDDQLKCVDHAVGSFLIELQPDIDRRFEALRDARLAPVFRAQARAWLSRRGLLDRVPRYQPGVTDDAAFTRQIEHLCGSQAKGAFQSKFGFHALSPDWVGRNLNPPDKGVEAFSCVMNVATVTGFKLGFIGNEYYGR